MNCGTTLPGPCPVYEVTAAPGGQRIAGAGQLLLLDQQLLAGGIPLLR